MSAKIHWSPAVNRSRVPYNVKANPAKYVKCTRRIGFLLGDECRGVYFFPTRRMNIQNSGGDGGSGCFVQAVLWQKEAQGQAPEEDSA